MQTQEREKEPKHIQEQSQGRGTGSTTSYTSPGHDAFGEGLRHGAQRNYRRVAVASSSGNRSSARCRKIPGGLSRTVEGDKPEVRLSTFADCIGRIRSVGSNECSSAILKTNTNFPPPR